MRLLPVLALSAALAVLAGCGSEPPPFVPAPMPEQAPFHSKDDKKQDRDAAKDKMPLQFLNMEGKQVNLTDYRGKSNVVLVVVKGLPQTAPEPFKGRFCPGCLAQVGELAARHKEFTDRQTEVLVVFPGPTDKVPDFLAQSKAQAGGPKLPFQLLYDTDLKAVHALGIDGDLARPSTYILDKQGNAVFAYIGDGSTYDRPSVPSLLTRLDKLNGKP